MKSGMKKKARSHFGSSSQKTLRQNTQSMAKSMKKSMKKASMKKASMKKAMKSGMKKKAKRVSNIAKGKRGKSSVFRGTKAKTAGGLKKSDLVRNKRGKVVSKKQAEAGKKAFAKSGLAKYAAATKAARKALGIKGFCPIGGKTAQGQALLKKVRSLVK